jgi:primosomal protein N'
MFVINVLPLSRTAPGILSYRSSSDLPAGSIVDITIRRTVTQGIVVSSLPVQDAKEMIKHARFLLSKSVPSPSGKIPDEIMQAAERVAEYQATSVGAVLAALFAEYVKVGAVLPAMSFMKGSGYVREVIEQSVEDRVEMYKKVIEECIERGCAALLIAPSIAECDFWKKTFSMHKPLLLTGAVAGTARAKALEKAAAHTGLIIATPSFSWVPVTNLGTIIIDRVSAGTYVLPKRPYISVPYALDALAAARSVPLYIGDYPVPLEYRAEPSAHILHTPDNISVLDVRRNKKELKEEVPKEDPGPWRALSENVIERIRKEIDEGGRVVVLATRKGYAPAVTCKDCGQAQTDDNGVPLLFSIAHGQRVFISRDGRSIISAKRPCTRCESWNLLPLGVGSERVVEELQAAFPDKTIATLTAEALTSRKAAKRALEEAHRPESILVGTEALLPWLLAYEGPRGLRPLGIIASADSLLSLPFWRARERFIRLSYFMSGLTSELLLLTRRPDDTAVQTLQKKSLTEQTKESANFWEEETMLRKALAYPPFGTLITLSFEGSAIAQEKFNSRILEDLTEYSPTILSEGSTIVFALPEGAWPNPALSTYLRELPPNIRVRIDPETLW